MSRTKILIAATLLFLTFYTKNGFTQECRFQVFPLNNVQNFPQLELLTPCGEADSLSFILFPGPNITYPTGATITFELPQGIEYAGFSDAIFGGITITELDIADLQNPIFQIDGIEPSETEAIYIGLRATCDLSPPEDKPINLILDYEANTGSNTITCQSTYNPIIDIINNVNIPFINLIDATPNPLAFQDFITPSCDTITIEHTNREKDSYINEFQLLIQDIGLNTVSLTSVQVNNMPFDINDPNLYNYDAALMQANLSIGGNFFLGNYHPFGPQITEDNRFDSDERLTVELCFLAESCVALTQDTIKLATALSCYEQQCFDATQLNVPLEFEPISRAEPDVSAISVQNGSLCGDPFIIDLMIQSDMPQADDGAFLDLRVLFDLCAAEQIMLTSAAIPSSDGGYTMLPFGETEVVEFDTLNSDGTLRVDIHFDRLTSDPDGANFGLEDISGNGSFGDLAGDQMIMLRLEYEVLCSEATDRMLAQSCSPLACTVESIIVEGVRNCTQQFQQIAPIDPPISYFYGADSVYTNEVNGEIQIGTGVIQANNSVQQGFELVHGYRFREDNIMQCLSPFSYAEIVIQGAPSFVDDLELIPNSISFSGTVIPDANAFLSPASANGFRVLTIDLGNIPNVSGQFEELRYELQFNECRCSPQLLSLYSRILEECDDCKGCAIVKSCEEIQVEKAANDCGNCDCLMVSVDQLMRQTTGFTDKNRTTQVDITNVNAADQKRFLPGDYMFTSTTYQFRVGNQRTLEAFASPSYWEFYVRNEPITQFGDALVDVCDTNWRAKTSLWSTNESTLTGFYIVRGGINSGNTPEALSFNNSNCIRFLDFPTRVDPSTGIDINQVDILPQGGQDFEEGNKTTIRIEGACLTAFLTANDLSPNEDFDIVLEHSWRVIPNPGYDSDLAPVIAVVNGGFGAGSSVSDFSDWYCGGGEAYEFHLPGPIRNNTDVTIKDCGVEISHNFTLENGVPLDWYTNEYRPIMGLAYADISYPSDLIFTGEIALHDYNGTFLSNLTTVQTVNATTSNFNGSTYYIANGNQGQIRIEDSEFTNGTGYNCEGLDNPYQILNPVSDNTLVGADMPLLATGFDSENCEFSLRYNLVRPCQDNLDIEAFQLIAGSSMSTTFCYAGSPWRADGMDNSTNDYLANDADKTTFGADMEQLANADLLYYWPYTADDFEEVTAFPYPSAYTDAGGTATTASDPVFANIYGVGRNPFNALDTTMTIHLMDMSSNFPSLTTSIASNLLNTDFEGTESNIYQICAGTDATMDLTNLVTTISIPATVELVNVCPTDAQANPIGAPLNLNVIATTATTTMYMLDFPDDNLAPGTCRYYKLTTDLLFCPIGIDIPTEVEIMTSSACLSSDFSQAVLGMAESCQDARETFSYKNEETDLQVEFITPQTPQLDLSACEEVCVAVRIINPKSVTLRSLNPIFFLPIGIAPVPGSWEIIYPGGPNNYADGANIDVQNCDNSENWIPIPDPTRAPPTRPRGTTYIFSLDDLQGIGIDELITNGLPGVSSTSSITDSNAIAIRFKVVAGCDAIGDNMRFLTTAQEPCETTIASNLVLSKPISIIRPDVFDYTPLISVAEAQTPDCENGREIIFSTINSSTTETMPLGLRQCIMIPSDNVEYISGSLNYVGPVSFDIMLEDIPIVDIQTNQIGTEVCFNTPADLPPGEFYQISFRYNLAAQNVCSNSTSVELSSTLSTSLCTNVNSLCLVHTLNTVNVPVPIDNGVLDISMLEVKSICDDDANRYTYAYSFELNNTLPSTITEVIAVLIPDVNQNGAIEPFEEMLANSQLITGLNISPTSTSTISETMQVSSNLTCPLFVRVRNEDVCECHIGQAYTNEISLELFEQLGTSMELCYGATRILDLCNDYAPSLGNQYTFTNNGNLELVVVSYGNDLLLEFEDITPGAVDFSLINDQLAITLNPNVGNINPILVSVSANLGACSTSHTIEIIPIEGIDKCLPASFDVHPKGGE